MAQRCALEQHTGSRGNSGRVWLPGPRAVGLFATQPAREKTEIVSRLIGLSAISLCTAWASAGQAPVIKLQAGVAQVEITPSMPLPMVFEIRHAFTNSETKLSYLATPYSTWDRLHTDVRGR